MAAKIKRPLPRLESTRRRQRVRRRNNDRLRAPRTPQNKYARRKGSMQGMASSVRGCARSQPQIKRERTCAFQMHRFLARRCPWHLRTFAAVVSSCSHEKSATRRWQRERGKASSQKQRLAGEWLQCSKNTPLSEMARPLSFLTLLALSFAFVYEDLCVAVGERPQHFDEDSQQFGP